MSLNTYNDYYEQVVQELRQENLASLSLDSLKEKVKSFALRNNINYFFLLNELKINPATRLFFQKDPKKQNAAEKAFVSFIQSELPESQIVSLPNSGKNSLLLASGLIVKASNKSIPGAKTIDFILTYKNKTYYITHKRTDGSGGSQKNQLLDVQNFLLEAKRNSEDNVIFVAILDGNYYDQKIMNNTKQLFFTKNKILVHNSDSFLKYLKSDI